MSAEASRYSVTVIGAGVVGASTALALQRGGHKVCLVDREGPAAGASFGN
jgi:D-amino-acid dehydrogenase